MPSDHSSVLAHAAAILDSFSIDHPELGVREVARMANLPASTAGRLMCTLKEMGILAQNPATRAYSIGSKVLAWSGVYMASLDIRTLALPFMSELHRMTRETISLYTLDGNERLCVERMESTQNVRIVSRVGHRLPLYAGSAGKAILAFLPPERQAAYLESIDLKPLTSQTIIDREALRLELVKVRRQGYAVSYGEWILEASGVAAPVFWHSREVIGALTISGPTQRFTPPQVDRYTPEVVRAAQEISRLMGYRRDNAGQFSGEPGILEMAR